MQELVPFDFQGNTIRALNLHGEAWIVAADVAKILSYSSAKDVARLLDGDEKGRHSVPTPGGPQDMTIISEPGLYSATLRSKSTLARPFRRWVTHTMIPSVIHQGGYINPKASEHQMAAILRRSQMQLELLQTARGLIQPDHLEAKARVIVARGLGEAPAPDAAAHILYVQDYLAEKGISAPRLKAIGGMFGKRVKAAYVLRHGRDPQKYPLNLSNGQVRQVNAYTDRDRDLMDQVWDQYYADEVA